jgi:ubiquinone/menaquinone biosynthesis C-methylase UbiE
MSENDRYIQKLIETNPLMEPVYRDAIRILCLPEGSRGLDAGCGIGLQTPMLAAAVGAEGNVTGLDISPELIAKAEEIIDEAGLKKQVSFEVGNIHALPFGDDTFDWLWSANCAGYPAQDPHALLKELGRVIRPIGKIAILIYTSQLLLPGYPRLEARLNATSAGIAPFGAGMKPGAHFTRVLGWFRDVGFEETSVKTLVKDVFPPLSLDMREAVASLIDMRWEGADSEMPADDRELFQRLTRPESQEYILNLPDYYAFFTMSLFQAKVNK